jgi:hypothetical protein
MYSQPPSQGRTCLSVLCRQLSDDNWHSSDGALVRTLCVGLDVLCPRREQVRTRLTCGSLPSNLKMQSVSHAEIFSAPPTSTPCRNDDRFLTYRRSKAAQRLLLIIPDHHNPPSFCFICSRECHSLETSLDTGYSTVSNTGFYKPRHTFMAVGDLRSVLTICSLSRASLVY